MNFRELTVLSEIFANINNGLSKNGEMQEIIQPGLANLASVINTTLLAIKPGDVDEETKVNQDKLAALRQSILQGNQMPIVQSPDPS